MGKAKSKAVRSGDKKLFLLEYTLEGRYSVHHISEYIWLPESLEEYPADEIAVRIREERYSNHEITEADITPVEAREVSFDEDIIERSNLLEAKRKAEKQRDCHNEQVSGCWSIDGSEFCKMYNLSEDEACEAQEEVNGNDELLAINEARAKAINLVGELTQQQEDELEKRVQDSLYPEEQGAPFWDNLVKQIERKLEENGE